MGSVMLQPGEDTGRCQGTSVAVTLGGSWHRVGGDRGCCSTPHNAQDGPQRTTGLLSAVLGRPCHSGRGDWIPGTARVSVQGPSPYRAPTVCRAPCLTSLHPGEAGSLQSPRGTDEEQCVARAAPT